MSVLCQPPSLCSVDSSDCTILCSSIPNSTFVVKKDQAIDKVGVVQLTCTVIHEEYDSELEHQSSANDDSLVSKPLLCFLDIFSDSTIHDFACVSPCMNVPIFYHLQNTRMSFYHPTTKRTNYSLKIHSNFIYFSQKHRR